MASTTNSFDIDKMMAEIMNPRAARKPESIAELEATLGEMGYQIYPSLGGIVKVRVEKINRGEPVAVIQAEATAEVSTADGGSGMEAYRMVLAALLRMVTAFERRNAE